MSGKRRPELHQMVKRGCAACGLAAELLLAGCASPGPPRPPSLNLPEIVTDLTARRVADQVLLRWTTPARTTDKLAIAGAVTAEVCRTAPAAALARPAGGRNRPGGRQPCAAVFRLRVSAGASEARDTLPATLAAGVPGLLAYRVQLLNGAGRSAGASGAAYAASGAAPEAVDQLRAHDTKRGVVLEWGAGKSGESVELERRLISPADATDAGAGEQKDGLTGRTKEPAQARFRATDAGGAIDRTARTGRDYAYTAQRVREVTLRGEAVELRSAISPVVTVAVRDAFPPDVPAALVAAPGYTDTGKPVIDLSWEPDMESGVAGYKVYRREGGGEWRLLSPEPVRLAAFSDSAVVAGRRYSYRVTAVSDAGLESAPGSEAAETAPAE